MKQISCRYCGKPIVFGANLNPIKDLDAINQMVDKHELECPHGEGVVNFVPENNSAKKDKNGKISLKNADVNPAIHIENAIVSIENIALIADELEESEIQADCVKICDEILQLQKKLKLKYRW